MAKTHEIAQKLNLNSFHMKKLLMIFMAALITGTLIAGGLVTNTNQSAAWVRLPARNASTGIDAAYFNPAGLMKLENGFHISVSNQTISQTKDVENFYTGPGGMYGLNENLFTGNVSAPLFPSVYAVYKMEKLAFSVGFNPVGGGGGAEYKKGLPSFAMGPSDLVPSLASQGVTDYRLDAYLKGSSVYMGFQGGLSYKVNDWLSVAAGIRYVMAKNSYFGHLTDIEVLFPSPVNWTRADAVMTGIANTATGSATGLQDAITAGLIQANDPISPTVAAGLTALGIDPTGFTNAIAIAAFGQAAAKYTATATLLGDQEIPESEAVEQTGSGITPIFSVNISPSEKLNIGIKYEMATRMELENKTTKDFLIGFTAEGTPITMFPNGEKTPSDMPALLSIGADYRLCSAAKLSVGANYFFDKSANYGHKLDLDTDPSTPSTFVDNDYIIDDNGMSLFGGIEVNITDKLLVSGGYAWANKGVNSNYQSDLTYGLATQTFGFGGAYNVLDNLQFNVGASYTLYKSDEKMINHVFSATGAVIPALETYCKNAMIIAVGLDFSF